jgi:hypothetical protein
MFDLDDKGLVPCHMWCFVSIKRAGAGTRHGGIDVVPGDCAVVERGHYVEDEAEISISSIFVPFKKEVRAMPQGAEGWKRKFYLANLESLQRPLAVIPNIGGNDGVQCFIVKNRSSWGEHFSDWLARPSANDVIGPEEPNPTISYLDLP